MDIIFVRLLFVVVVAATCYVIQPFGRPAIVDAGIGAFIGATIVLFEWKLRTVSLKKLIGAAIGSILGICGAYLFALVIRSSVPEGHTQSFLQILVMLLMAYVGLIVGANKGDLLNLAALGAPSRGAVTKARTPPNSESVIGWRVTESWRRRAPAARGEISTIELR